MAEGTPAPSPVTCMQGWSGSPGWVSEGFISALLQALDSFILFSALTFFLKTLSMCLSVRMEILENTVGLGGVAA